MKVDPEMPDSDVTAEYLAENIWIVGSPDEVEQKVRKLYDDVGGFGVLLAMGHEWQPRDQWERSATLLAEEVMPPAVRPGLADLLSCPFPLINFYY